MTRKLLLPLLALAALALPARAQGTIPTPDPAIAEFARGVKFTVNGYQGGEEVQTNFPVLVRLSTAITGFDYGDFYNASVNPTDPDALKLVDVGFVDAEGNGLAYDIDTWDTSGESLVWVNLPRMTNGTEFAMWYRSSKTGKALNPDNVWTNYAGVWHFREDYGTETDSVKVYDSTTNSLTGDTFYSTKSKSSSYASGKPGRARKIASANDPKGIGAITIPLGVSGSAKRNAVDSLGQAFSASFWVRHETGARYNYFIGRKNSDDYESWALQHHDSIEQWRIYSNGKSGKDDGTGYAKITGIKGFSTSTWKKIDIVYTSEGTTGKYYLYHDGVEKTSNGANLVPGKVTQGGLDLYIGGGADGGQCRPLVGEMDEVRLCYSVPTAKRVRADYDTVNDTSFLTRSIVVTNTIIERPVVSFSVADVGASHIQFGGDLTSLGSDQATECTFYAKVWPTAFTEPTTWTALGTDLGTGAFSGLVKGLTPATAYSYRLKVTNDDGAEGVDSYETAADFTTSGVGVGGTGGDVTRVGDDWIHFFRVGTDDESGDTVNTYTFTPPSYASTVRALVVAGGGPGGYKAGGGGGAGGYIYNAALSVTEGDSYMITVGEGGAASDSTEVFGAKGGDSSISNGVTQVVRAIGGGAGGNYSNNNNYRKGQDGGSGGGSPHSGADAGAGTNGQGNAGGKGNTKILAGGGGGASGTGGSAPATGNNQNAGAGGAGLECDITGTGVYYAGGGGGGGMQVSDASGSPGAGGNGGGGTGSRKDAGGTAAAATAGVDGLGGGGGGGCGDVDTLYKGGDGGDGIVIIRYGSQGDFRTVLEPIISLQSAVCNDTTFKGDVAFRVAWAGYGHDDVAEVRAVWGYAKTALTHSDVIATDAIGLGTGSFPLKADKRTVYLKLLAVNADGEEAYSSEMLSFYVNENAQAVEDDDMPILENVALEADAVWAKVSGVVVSAGQASGTPKTCTVRVRYGTAATALSNVVAANGVAVGDFTIPIAGLSLNTTYYYAVEIEDDAGTVIPQDTASFTTLPQPSFSAIATNVDKTQLTVSGGLSVAGGGVTTVFVTWGDAEPTVFATFTKDSATTAFVSTNALQTWAENVAWKVVYSNELTNADGTGNGTITTKEYSGSLSPVDTATYTWQAADGEWSGNWTNKAHWASNISCCRGYPNEKGTSAIFRNCTTNNPVVVTLDEKYSTGFFVPNAVKGGSSDITFHGAGRATSGLTVESPVVWNNDNHVCSDTQIKFENMSVAFANDWSIMRYQNDNGGPVAYSNILVRFSNVGLTTNNKQLKLCAPYSRLEFTDGTTAAANEVTVSGTDSVLLVDDSTVTVKTNLRLGVQCLPNDGVAIVFRGAAPKLTTQKWFSPWKLTGQPAGVIFEVPVGGYDSTPFVFDHNSNTFGQPDNEGTQATHTFAVSPDSPALKVNATIENNVLVQTTAGFYSTVLSDSVFTVPERDGSPTGAFKWGAEGAPLAEGAELSTARQLLLDLEGAGFDPSDVMLLIW